MTNITIDPNFDRECSAKGLTQVTVDGVVITLPLEYGKVPFSRYIYDETKVREFNGKMYAFAKPAPSKFSTVITL